MLKYKHILRFMDWIDSGGFWPTVVGVLEFLLLAPHYYWGSRNQYPGFCNFRERVRKFGRVGRFVAGVLDPVLTGYPTRGEYFWLVIIAVLYVGFYAAAGLACVWLVVRLLFELFVVLSDWGGG